MKTNDRRLPMTRHRSRLRTDRFPRWSLFWLERLFQNVFHLVPRREPTWLAKFSSRSSHRDEDRLALGCHRDVQECLLHIRRLYHTSQVKTYWTAGRMDMQRAPRCRIQAVQQEQKRPDLA